jgi:hypothetical protein
MEKIMPDDLVHSYSSTLDSEGLSFGNGNDGLTYRQYYTGLAMQGLCARPPGSDDMKSLANKAVEIADEVIKALNK